MNAHFNQIINTDKPVLIDFYTSRCEPCQKLGLALKQVKESLGERISIIKIDVNKNQEIAASYHVKGVPTIMLFQNGRRLWSQPGILSKDEIIHLILLKFNQLA